jgi:hypothetical protein
MLKFEEKDYRPLTEFPLSWRWTDSRWNKLPDDALQTIKPLTEAKAKELWRVSGYYCPPNGPRVDIFECSEWIDATLDVEGVFDKVRAWLLSHIPDINQEAIISWDMKHAATTICGVFCDYWDDFCYPSSDDVVIFPASFDWILLYDHCERFDFGDKRLKSR